MSLLTWTAAALSSDSVEYSGDAWRVVEAQHRVSTLSLVDTLAEQELLESILEETKAPIPLDCRDLDYLLSTPFRYEPPYPYGSRFRRAGRTSGVFYASEVVDTAIAELAFYRLLFYAESPATPFPQGTTEYTAFTARLHTTKMIDLSAPPLDQDISLWTDRKDYSDCQALADVAREAEIEVIRYASVRAPSGGVNLAILTCKAFAERAPVDLQSWRIKVSLHGVQAICEYPRRGLEFVPKDFQDDPRLNDFNWMRS